MLNRFAHHRLDVYRFALQLAVLGSEPVEKLPAGQRGLADQLARSAPGVALLIAEGANRRTAAQKRQRFVEARGECGEAAATVEVLCLTGHVSDDESVRFHEIADRVAAMLSGLIRRHS